MRMHFNTSLPPPLSALNFSVIITRRRAPFCRRERPRLAAGTARCRQGCAQPVGPYFQEKREGEGMRLLQKQRESKGAAGTLHAQGAAPCAGMGLPGQLCPRDAPSRPWRAVPSSPQGHLAPLVTPSPCWGDAGDVPALSYSHCMAAPSQGDVSWPHWKMQKVIWLPSN